MAVLKHLPVRNADYAGAQTYLLFEHDERGKLLYDEDGHMILRKGFIQSGLNCDPFSFNTECAELNAQWGKNRGKNDVFAHHYIMSFDPRDAECGLTSEKAHAIAEEFAKYFFAGHQVLLVTHPDGHNGSGNIHTHIVLNSLRKENILYRDFMNRPTDCLAGYKHHQTRDLFMTMLTRMDELCEREHLHTVDFSVPADRKINDREYKARKRGQEHLDESNQPIIDAGLHPRVTDYRTIKDEIRNAVDAAVKKAKTEEDFRRILEEQYHIEQKETRGVWSYIHPNRSKPIRARSLGRIYEKGSVMNRILGIDDIDHSRPEYADLPKIFVLQSDLQLVVDIQNCVKAQQSAAYARKVEISNLQQMAKSVAYLSTHKIGTLDNLRAMRAEAEQEYKSARDAIREDYLKIKGINEEIHYLGKYLTNKKVYSEFLNAPNKAAYRQAHQSQVDAYEEARTFLKTRYPNTDFPTLEDLNGRKTKLERHQTSLNSKQQSAYNRMKELRIVDTNITALLAPHTPEMVLGRKRETVL